MIQKNNTSRSQEKLRQLHRLLANFKRVGVAFSGGADSSFLLRSALDVLGPDRVVILHGRSCLQKRGEQVRTASWPERHGYDLEKVQQRIIDLQPLSWPEFVANPENRCYLCKKRVYSIFLDTLQQEGISILLDGTNSDDLQQGEQGRPGLRTIAELDVRTPLAECGLSKAEIRALSQDLELDTWDLPSSSCLATRIPHSMSISTELLEYIEFLEREVLETGFQDCRIRLTGLTECGANSIILQLPANDLDRFCIPRTRQAICSRLKNLGASKILLDLNGR